MQEDDATGNCPGSFLVVPSGSESNRSGTFKMILTMKYFFLAAFVMTYIP